MDYAKKNGYLHPKYFVDDGISGTTFDRPGVREMEALIEAGKVSAVIVKDLSRFGREHVETSRYLEIIYPTLGVKFVAIQERVDTETGEGAEMMPFHNIFNVFYSLIPQTDSYSSCKSYTSIAPSPLISAAFRKSAADRPPDALPVTR